MVAPNSPTMRVASYNIRKAIGLDRRRNPERILKTINQLKADIVGLQEVDRRFGTRKAALPKDLIGQNTDYVPVSIDGSGSSLGWHGNSILLHRNIPVKSMSKLELPTFEPRGALLIEFDWHGCPTRLISGHFGLTPKYRQKQLQVISDKLRQLPELPTILIGDFNEWRTKKGFDALPENYQLHTPGKSFPAILPVVALDRIATSPTIHLKASGVFKSDQASIGSDHLPVWADLNLNSAP